MSFTQQEVELLKGCLKEIVDENYFSTIHELKKKLVASTAKQQELESRLDQYKEGINKLNECHQCHTSIVERRDMFTQTIEEDFVEGTHQRLERERCAGTDKNLNESNNASRQSNSGDTTTTSETPQASTSFHQEPAIQPKLEIQAEEPKNVAGTSKPNHAAPTDVEIICISDDD